jgi:hypothetical protein
MNLMCQQSSVSRNVSHSTACIALSSMKRLCVALIRFDEPLLQVKRPSIIRRTFPLPHAELPRQSRDLTCILKESVYTDRKRACIWIERVTIC